MMKTPHLILLLSAVTLATACTPMHSRYAHQNPQYQHPYPPQQQYAPPGYQQSQPPQQQYAPPGYQQSPPPQQNYSPALGARRNVVELAFQQLGTSYKYGGDSPREGFDCSGLMTYVHQQAVGLKLPRTAAQQRNRSKTVRYANLQPGDMLFFKTGSRTNHVGLYIGDRKFIHAPNRRSRVQITTMDNAYWHSKFVKFGTYFDS